MYKKKENREEREEKEEKGEDEDEEERGASRAINRGLERKDLGGRGAGKVKTVTDRRQSEVACGRVAEG